MPMYQLDSPPLVLKKPSSKVLFTLRIVEFPEIMTVLDVDEVAETTDLKFRFGKCANANRMKRSVVGDIFVQSGDC